MTKYSLSSVDIPFPSSSVLPWSQSAGGIKLVDHAANALLDVGVQSIYLVGSYEPRYFYDYCNKKSVECKRPVK